MRVRDQVIELNAMYKNECFYYVERKPRKKKADGKGKNKDENDHDMDVDQEDDIKVEEKVVPLKKEKKDGKTKEKSKTYRIFHIYWLMQKQIEHYNKNKAEYNIKLADKFTREFSLLPHKQNFTISHLHLTNTTLFGTKALEIKYGCKDIESELFLETFFNPEKIKRKINKAFCKRSLKE